MHLQRLGSVVRARVRVGVKVGVRVRVRVDAVHRRVDDACFLRPAATDLVVSSKHSAFSRVGSRGAKL